MSRTGSQRARSLQPSDHQDYTLVFYGIPTQITWKELKDEVRDAGAKFPRDSYTFPPEQSGGIKIGECIIRGEADAWKCYHFFQRNGLSEKPVSLNLYKGVGPQSTIIEQFVPQPQPITLCMRPTSSTAIQMVHPRSERIGATVNYHRKSAHFPGTPITQLASTMYTTQPVPSFHTVHYTSAITQPPTTRNPIRHNVGNMNRINPSSWTTTASEQSQNRLNRLVFSQLAAGVQPLQLQRYLKMRFDPFVTCSFSGHCEIKATFTSSTLAAYTYDRLHKAIVPDIQDHRMYVKFDQVVESSPAMQSTRSSQTPQRYRAATTPSVNFSSPRKPPLIVDGSRNSTRRRREVLDSDDEDET